jgi:5-methyltetrahydrofolate--homocysteine methyltransferase
LKKFDYLEALSQSVLIFDGAMGTNLQQLNLQPADFGGEHQSGCNDVLCLTKPEAVEQVHRAFLEVGVDVIETNTFRSNRLTLQEFDLQDKVWEINQAAATLAKQLAQAYSTSGHQRFVAGSIGPSGKILSIDDPQSQQISFHKIVTVVREQALALLEGGVDLLLLETQQDLLEVKAAVLGIQQAFNESGIQVPLQAQVTMDVHNRMLFGSDIEAVSAILEPLAIQVLGLNCSTGPDEMEAPLRFLGENCGLPVSCLPNAGMPEMQGQDVIYPLLPEHFAERLTEYVEKYQLSVVGGCCGTTPQHLAFLVNSVHGHPAPHPTASRANFLSSPIHAREMNQTPPPFIIGERLNTQGSRNFKRLMLAQDFRQAEALARQQVADGAHGLDLCTALTENELEKENLVTLIRRISHGVDAPLIIDSTDLQVMEAALQATPGRCLINSTHFESGEEKARRVFELAKQYGAAVMVLTIDENGMAKSSAHKNQIVERAYPLAVEEIGLAPSALVFDPLTFSLASGDPATFDSAVQTFDSLRWIQQHYPDCHTSLGISNISFGFSKAARKILNSVFLYHALQAGLDMAILNPAEVLPYHAIAEQEKQAAEALLFNRSKHALADFMRVFESHAQNESNETHANTPLAGMAPGKRIQWRVLNRERGEIEKDIEDFIQQATASLSPHQAALSLLNEFLLPAMKEVGEQFSQGEIILPFVLQSSEIMRAATLKLEEFIQKSDQSSRGTVLLATVYGDVHDIGKNLVKTILENNGFEVIDLGKQVPVDQIVEQATQSQVSAIGLSALLVNTSQQMPRVVEKLHHQHSAIPVLIGGAAVNQAFADRIVRLEEQGPYAGGVYYCRDAFDALAVLDKLPSGKGEKA